MKVLNFNKLRIIISEEIDESGYLHGDVNLLEIIYNKKTNSFKASKNFNPKIIFDLKVGF